MQPIRLNKRRIAGYSMQQERHQSGFELAGQHRESRAEVL
jgi:hypothetical protein